MNDAQILTQIDLQRLISVKLEGEDMNLSINSALKNMIKSRRKTKMFILVKLVIDCFDLYCVSDVSSDEYDGESRRISHKIKEQMTMEEMAEIMKKEFNWSFSAKYSTKDFFWPAKRLYVLLNTNL